ncbi:hypothetical protein V6B14_22275 (plasmid) [Sporosarcina psychrophila]
MKRSERKSKTKPFFGTGKRVFLGIALLGISLKTIKVLQSK